MTLLGVDPGFKGALAFLADERTVVAYNMPITKRPNGKTYLDAEDIARLVEQHGPSEAWIEDVYSSPQMGVTSAFSFGEGKGTLIGVLAALRVPVRFVSPARWKREMRLTAEKADAKQLARGIFGKHALSNEGKCEAALIGLYGLLSQSSSRTS